MEARLHFIKPVKSNLNSLIRGECFKPSQENAISDNLT